MGRGDLRGHDPGRCPRRGDLTGSVRGSWHPHPVSCALPDVHPIRGNADAGPDCDAEAHHQRQGNPDPNGDPDPHPDRYPNPVQPGAAGLPDSATRTDHLADADSQDNPDCRRCDTDCNADTHSDAGPDHPAELDAAPHRDPDPDTLVRLSGAGFRVRRAACCR